MGDCTVEHFDQLIDLEKTAIVEREIVIIQLEQLPNLMVEQGVTSLSEVVQGTSRTKRTFERSSCATRSTGSGGPRRCRPSSLARLRPR